MKIQVKLDLDLQSLGPWQKQISIFSGGVLNSDHKDFPTDKPDFGLITKYMRKQVILI